MIIKKNAISPILLSYLYIKKKKKKKKYNEKLGPRSHDWEREPAVAYAAPFLAYPDFILLLFFFSMKGENIAILKTQDVNEVLIKGIWGFLEWVVEENGRY